MRRNQCRVQDQAEIKRILASTNIGRMATVGADGYPYITPVNFVFFQGRIYFHCAPTGEKLDNIKRHSRVCFEVDVPLAYLDMGFDPARPICRLHQFYHCVIVRGTASLVEDLSLKLDALNALVKKHEPAAGLVPLKEDTPQVHACEVVEIRPENVTAKSDLAQGKGKEVQMRIARYLSHRGLPGDAETVEAMDLVLEP